MKRWSFKVKVGVYAALLTMAALVAGVGVMMVTLYFYQIAGLDRTLAEDAEELVWDLKNFRDAPKDPGAPLSEEFIPVPLRNHYLVVEGPDEKIVYQSANLRGTHLEGKLGETRTMDLFGDVCRVGAWRVEPYVVRIGAKVQMIERFQKDLGIGFITALPAVGLVVFFGGMWLARRTVAPLAELSAAAERISASNPRERLPQPAAQDEISKLTEVLNRSFDRLQSSYEVATRFSADASHQLKTPVTILRAGLDHLSRATDLSEAQSAEVSTLRQQTRRLTSLIEDLLLLAQADAGRVFLEKEEIDLNSLVQAAGDDLNVLVAGRGISVEEHLPEALPVRADRRLLAMVLQNLVENAAKYTLDGGAIRISGLVDGESVLVRIANTGKRISETDRELIFERFRRGNDTGGNVRGHGLGLNIARELVRAHGGDVCLNQTDPGWIEFEFRLPAAGGDR
jgi:signal transduction histidine kinase